MFSRAYYFSPNRRHRRLIGTRQKTRAFLRPISSSLCLRVLYYFNIYIIISSRYLSTVTPAAPAAPAAAAASAIASVRTAPDTS